MGILDDARGRDGEAGDGRRADPFGGPSGAASPADPFAAGERAPVPAAPGAGAPSPGDAGPDAGQRSELRRRRDALAEQVTELHWDLGGLTYEMAIRDHFRLDVLVRRAAILQERDAELAELERLLRMEDGAVAGACPVCKAPHSRGALYCWQCGETLMERRPSESAPEPLDGDTAVLDALLAPGVRERPIRDDEV
jgi:hypothetical protein